MKVFARQELALDKLDIGEAALLLEGAWSEDCRGPDWHSLDESIDARYAWIDERAEHLAERIGRLPVFRLVESNGQGGISLAYLHALSLRYYLVKLLRVVAFFRESDAGREAGSIDLVATAGRDEDYAELLREICRQRGLAFSVTWSGNGSRPQPALPPNEIWRQAAANVNGVVDGCLERWNKIARRGEDLSAERVMLCGNPAVLDPLCGELLSRGCQVAWLYDRFAVGGWRRWRARGVRQLVCQSSLGRRNGFVPGPLESSLAEVQVEGISLARSLTRWLTELGRQRGPRQTRLVKQTERHMWHWRPTTLVVDEDATPLARAAIAAARRVSAASVVVQHGAPRVRFGFAPLAADRILVWGESSRQQLIDWGIAPQRIQITGSAKIAATARKVPSPAGSSQGPKQILFFATTPPSDHRPDAVSYHLTSHTHAKMLRMACAAVAGIVDAELVFKLHPRSRCDAGIQRIAAAYPGLKVRLVRGNVQAHLDQAACVLNCGSSAGIEAAAQGVPVIELLPEGSLDLTPASDWNLFASARNLSELNVLLNHALHGDWDHQRTLHCDRVFARRGAAATRAAADAILGLSTPAAVADERAPANCEVAV